MLRTVHWWTNLIGQSDITDQSYFGDTARAATTSRTTGRSPVPTTVEQTPLVSTLCGEFPPLPQTPHTAKTSHPCSALC